MPRSTRELMINARAAGRVVPAFNIPYLPMMKPIVRALRDTNCFGLIAVARLEWEKFESQSLRAVQAEYERVKDERFTRLHLDHVPVIDEDDLPVDYESIIAKALELGYGSVMVDGSRLPLAENIAATRRITDLARVAGVPVEAELGAVLGHESGPLPPYEELFASGRGFTDPGDAQRFVEETGVDWLSVAIGNIHGAISKAARDAKKIAARLDISHLDRISAGVGIPLVLHGGSGIRRESLQAAFRHGIAKINIGTTVRQAYETAIRTTPEVAERAVYDNVIALITDELGMVDSAAAINPQ